jgi:hypothetical protein
MSSIATTLASQTQNGAPTQNSADSAEKTEQSALDGDTKSNMTHGTDSADETNTVNNPDDGVIQDLWGLLENKRPDHLSDPWGTEWSSFVASLDEECEIYLKKDWPTSTLVVISSYDWNIPVAFGRTGVEGRFFTCSMFFWTDSCGQLVRAGDDEDGYVDKYHRRRMVDRHNSLNEKMQKTITDLSSRLTLERLLKEIDVNRLGNQQVSVNGNDSAAWLRLAPDERTSTLIGVRDLEKEVWYDAPEPES